MIEVKTTEQEILENRANVNSQGHRAFKAGKSEDSNPYRVGSEFHKEWNNGYIEAVSESI